MVGTFRLAPGYCDPETGTVTGSWFRLAFPQGAPGESRWFRNATSRCADNTYTLVRPGSDGGLVTGSFQPAPTVAFTRRGDARAGSIIRPVSFTGVGLSLSTASVDPQSGRGVPAPVVVYRAGRLSGQLQAVSAAWDRVFINQGSPKPGGRRPGETRAVRGTYDARTRAFVLTWTSQIVGGRFNQFAVTWHLAGTLGRDASFVALPEQATPHPSTTTTSPPRAVTMLNCNATPDGWSAGGVAVNRGTRTGQYAIVVAFVAASGRRLASASTAVTLRPGNNTLWSVQAAFAAPRDVRCVLEHVTVTSVGNP